MCAAHYHLLKTNLCFYELLQWSAFPSFFLSFRCFLVSCEQGSNSDWVRSQSWAGVAKQRNGTSIDSLSPNHPLTLPLNPAPVCVRVRCQPKRSYTQFSASLSGREKEQRLLQQNSHSFPVLNRSLRIAVAVVAWTSWPEDATRRRSSLHTDTSCVFSSSYSSSLLFMIAWITVTVS